MPTDKLYHSFLQKVSVLSYNSFFTAETDINALKTLWCIKCFWILKGKIYDFIHIKLRLMQTDSGSPFPSWDSFWFGRSEGGSTPPPWMLRDMNCLEYILRINGLNEFLKMVSTPLYNIKTLVMTKETVWCKLLLLSGIPTFWISSKFRYHVLF